MPIYVVTVKPEDEQAIIDRVDEDDRALIYPGSIFVHSTKSTAKDLFSRLNMGSELHGVVVRLDDFTGYGPGSVAAKLKVLQSRDSK